VKHRFVPKDEALEVEIALVGTDVGQTVWFLSGTARFLKTPESRQENCHVGRR
jgi:sigma54-dependent transcription regulator